MKSLGLKVYIERRPLLRRSLSGGEDEKTREETGEVGGKPKRVLMKAMAGTRKERIGDRSQYHSSIILKRGSENLEEKSGEGDERSSGDEISSCSKKKG